MDEFMIEEMIRETILSKRELRKDDENMNNENKCEHNYFLASKTEELCKSLDHSGLWEHYKIGTLICRKCTDTKQATLDVYTMRR